MNDIKGVKLGDFSGAISGLCEEKGISKEKVLETIEAALAAAYKKDYGKKGQNIRAIFDDKLGTVKFYLVKEVVDESTREFPKEGEEQEEENLSVGMEAPMEEEIDEEEKIPRFNVDRDIILEEAKKIEKGSKVGDELEIPLEAKSDYGRVAAQTAKQVIIQKIREAERDAMFEEYKSKEGEILNGTVQRIEGRNVFVDLGRSTGVLFPSEQIEKEDYRIGQRLKIYVLKVDSGTKGPGIALSRSHADMVKKLFELEVPEIFSGTVEIKAVAREAGERSKIAVYSNEEGVDPIGSCVGQKGTRVQTIIDELGGEKIDIILWDEDPAKFISAALSPAKILKVELSEESQEAKVTVMEDQLSLAIGKRGQNVRLAAKLTNWKIDILGVKEDGEVVKAEEALEEKREEEPKEELKEEKPKEDKKEEVEDKKDEKKTEKKAKKEEKDSQEEKETKKDKK